MRFTQELVLGIGGARVLAALGIDPAIWHVNEGHAALSLLERIRMEGGHSETSEAAVRAHTLFTLHTPVPAGNEVFASDVVRRTLDEALPGIATDRMLELGRSRNGGSDFDLGAMAIRLAATTNGVSQRHASVVNNDWGDLIGGGAVGVTNGVHPQSWIGGAVARILRRVLGPDWPARTISGGGWEALFDVPDEDLWKAHLAQKQHMLRDLRSRLRDQYARHGMSPDGLRRVKDYLPDDRLTIVFARRFATYKRANLLFSDPGRLRRLLTDAERPVQIVFAGKAHPADREGQALIRWVVEMSRTPDLAGHIFFVENYDLGLGASLVQGADVWLNHPRPPREASGTSGMKAAGNGGLNLSVLDGWWLEGFNGKNGWGFGEHETSDAEDAATLYHLLESEVVPLFHDREAGVPRAWVRMMKEAMASVIPQFSSHRMVVEYTERFYLPLGRS